MAGALVPALANGVADENGGEHRHQRRAWLP